MHSYLWGELEDWNVDLTVFLALAGGRNVDRFMCPCFNLGLILDVPRSGEVNLIDFPAVFHYSARTRTPVFSSCDDKLAPPAFSIATKLAIRDI